MAPHRRDTPCVRLFISVDLVGSTAFKNSRRKEIGGERPGPPWVDVLTAFYSGFPQVFERTIDGVRLAKELQPKLVKTIGDEVLLQTEIARSSDARKVVRFLGAALVEYKKKNLSDQPLLLKAAAWIAGFPINNHRVVFAGIDRGEDFIGPSMDTGFRIAKVANPSRLIVSVDLAVLLLAGSDSLELYFEDTESLRGVLDGRPYPIIWYKVSGEDGVLHQAELDLRKHSADRSVLTRYCNAYIESCLNAARDTWLIRPYFRVGVDAEFERKPDWHETVMRTWEQVDKRDMQVGRQGRRKPASSTQRRRSRQGGAA